MRKPPTIAVRRSSGASGGANRPPATAASREHEDGQPDHARRPQDRRHRPRPASAGRRRGRAPSRWRSSRRSAARSRPRPGRCALVAERSSRHGRWTSSRPASRSPTPSHAAGDEPLPEDADADRDRQQRRGPAGQRVDDREVAAPEGRGEEREVQDLDRRPRRCPSAHACGGTPGCPSASQPTTHDRHEHDRRRRDARRPRSAAGRRPP